MRKRGEERRERSGEWRRKADVRKCIYGTDRN